jgi:hypothetical protein
VYESVALCKLYFIPEEFKVNETGRRMPGFFQMQEIANDK